jgi:aerobic carbon-monoxide dehydrogenase large subunit
MNGHQATHEHTTRRAHGIGASVLRLEDKRLLRGEGRYVSDIHIAGALHCVFVRSSHAHAAIRNIDAAAALRSRGVVAVLTGADLAADGIGPMKCLWAIRSHDGRPMSEPPRWSLARDKVRYIGEPVVAVITTTHEEAQDAAEAVSVEYAPLSVVVDARVAAAAGASRIHESAPENVCFRWRSGDEEAVARQFQSAAHVTGIEIINNRLIGAAMEPRAVVAEPRPDGLTLYSSTQVPHHIRRLVAEQLGIPEIALRVVAPNVGGGFGYKGKHYPEETILAWAARRLRRPVRWTASRSESFISDYQGRDHLTRAELALDPDGHFLALRVETFANLGAYVSTFGAAIPSAIYGSLLAGVYRTPAISVSCTGVFTNTVPTDAYRGAGRPEACYVLERLADEAAFELGIDRAEIRRRNLIPRGAMPYKTPIGPTYDCGDFPKLFARALAVADHQGFEARRLAALRRRRLRGFGMACYVESSGVAPSRLAGQLGARAGFFEQATIRVQGDGTVVAMLGTHDHGQGHPTTMAQILVSKLGVPLDRIRIVEGDTDRVPFGTGTFGSRSIAVGGSALDRAAGKIIAKGRRIAAHLLEAAPDDIAFADGHFAVAGTDRSVDIAAVARAAHIPAEFPLETEEPGWQETAAYDPSNFAFSNGTHLCEVEIDPETATIELVSYWAVDDIGTVINPIIVEGQLHGGIAQGVGQALFERCFYDSDSGQLLTGSFLDYALPHATDLPLFVSEFDESAPCTHNPLGAKGCGEAGAIAAPAAIISAVIDATRILGITDLQMPLTPGRLWSAFAAAVRRKNAG